MVVEAIYYMLFNLWYKLFYKHLEKNIELKIVSDESELWMTGKIVNNDTGSKDSILNLLHYGETSRCKINGVNLLKTQIQQHVVLPKPTVDL